jgi:hypothetical protein
MVDEAFNAIAFLVELFVVPPRFLRVRLRRHDRNAALLVSLELCGFQESSPYRCIMSMPGGQAKGDTRMRACREEVNLRRQPSTRASERLGSLFLRAPLAA